MTREDIGSAQLDEWRRWSDELRARRWLADNVRRARFQRLNDRELLHCLRELPEENNRVPLLDVLSDRVEEGTTSFRSSVAGILKEIARENPGPGRHAAAVDHGIQRLLHRLPQPIGGPVAAASLKSPRRRRKAAAWKYYHRQGLDDEGRELLASQFAVEESEEYLKLVAGDPQLVRRLGVPAILEVAPNRYWRTRAIEAVIPSDADDRNLRDTYPAEWLWAVARLGSRERLADVLGFLDREDVTVDIVNRVLLCVVELGDREAIDRALAAGEALLDTEPPADPRTLEDSHDQRTDS